MKAKDTGQESYDVFTDEGSCKVSERISDLVSLAGMVITLPEGWSGKLKGIEDVSRLLRGLFLPLKTFLQSPAKKFVVLIHSREDSRNSRSAAGRRNARTFSERSAGISIGPVSHTGNRWEIGRDTDLRVALRNALDRGCPVVEIMHRDGRVFTSEGHVAPTVFGDSSGLDSGPWRRCSHVRRRNRDQRPPGPLSCAFRAPPGLSGEDPSRSRTSIPQSRAPKIRLLRPLLSTPGHRRSPGPWRICTPQGSRQHTIPVM